MGSFPWGSSDRCSIAALELLPFRHDFLSRQSTNTPAPFSPHVVAEWVATDLATGSVLDLLWLYMVLFFYFLGAVVNGMRAQFFFCGRQMLLFCLSFYVWQGNQTFVNHPSFLMRSWLSLFVNLHPIWNSQTGVFYVLSIVLPTAINLYTKYNWPHNIGVEENFRMLLQSYTTIIGSGKCWVHLMKSWKANGTLFAGKVY